MEDKYMKTRYMIFAAAALAALAACNRENLEPVPAAPDGAKVYRFTASVEDPMTKSFFKNEEAPSRFIYWEDTDVFDFHDVTASGGKESVNVTSGKPASVAVDQRSVLFEKAAHDYMVISYPAKAVKLDSTVVSVTVPRDQELSSTLNPSYVPMVTSRIALSDAAKAKIASGEDTVSVAWSEAPLKVYPLAGLVKMHLSGLPGVTAASINKVVIMAEFNGSTSAGQPQRGLRGENVFNLAGDKALLSAYASGDNYTRFNVNLTTDKPVAYTAEGGVDVCFVANHSNFGMKTLSVAVYTTDGTIVKKKFDTSKNTGIGFNKARVSSFTLDFTTGAVSKPSSTKFAVEWSKGYLVYDAENKAYTFGGPFDIGLYFKFGSPVGYRFYASTEDYDKRIHPVDAQGNFLPSNTFMEGGQTLANGTDFFFQDQMYNGARYYTEEQTGWKDKVYYYPEGGSVLQGTLTDRTQYYNLPGSTSFAGSNDPCSYVKVAAGEKPWRIPTEEEVMDLINTGAAGIEFGNTDGSDMKNNDGKSRYVRYTDGDQTFYLKANGYINQAFSTYHTLSNTYGNKYAATFWTTGFVPYAGTATTGARTSNGRVYNLSLSSPATISTAATVTNRSSNTLNNYTGSWQIWMAENVRCVRDK